MRTSKPLILLGTTLGTILPLAAFGDLTSGDFYYTQYAAHNLNKRHYDYDGAGTFSLSAPALIKNLPGADGVIFDTAGNLLVGGQGPDVYRVSPDGSTVDTSTTPGSSNFHLGLDPSGTKVWAGGIPGPLNEIALPGFGAGTIHTVHLPTGAPIGVDTIAFDPTHGNQAYFTSSSPNGFGLFGTLDLTTFIATPIIDPAEPGSKEAAHGLAWDGYTDKFVLMGDTEIGSYDPSSGIFKSTHFSGFSFDQGAVDGKGHLFVAGSGQVTFLDYSGASDVTSYSFAAHVHVEGDIDDIAPLSGPGSHPVPDSSGLVVLLGIFLPLFGDVYRRRSKGAL